MIETRELEKVYRSGQNVVRAVRGVTLEVKDGECLAIVGPSGSGKSTLMNVLGCLDTASGGEYLLDGQNVTGLSRDGLARVRNRKIGFVFQNFNLLPHLTAVENVALPLMYMGVPLRERQERAEQALERVGLYLRRGHLPAQMSGGQQQRVAIARALITDPPLLLADEPTGNLDSCSGGEILRYMLRLNERGSTVVLITHDDGVARRCARRVEMRDGLLRPVE